MKTTLSTLRRLTMIAEKVNSAVQFRDQKGQLWMIKKVELGRWDTEEGSEANQIMRQTATNK